MFLSISPTSVIVCEVQEKDKIFRIRIPTNSSMYKVRNPGKWHLESNQYNMKLNVV